MVLHGAQQSSIPYETPYNLQSDQAYTQYLPARVKVLVDVVTREGIDVAKETVRTDEDLDSYLFILSVEKPVKMLAYSRQQQFFDKTAQEIQQLIFPACASNTCNVQTTFDQWLSAARKGGTYVPYLWRLNPTDAQKYQVAYVQQVAYDGKLYVVGAALFVDEVPNHIILKHQVETVAHRIKKEGFEKGTELINNDPDPEYYFFMVTLDEPMRWIAHGRNSWLVSRTTDEAQRMLFPGCKTVACRLDIINARFKEVALHGGGYHAYLWRAKPTDPIKLKVAYVSPVSYNKIKVLVGTGATPPLIPDYVTTELPQKVDQTIVLLHDIGFDNALSAIKHDNTLRLYIFIAEQQPPYTIVAHVSPLFTGRRARDVRWLANNQSIKGFDLEKLMTSQAAFSKTGGGFFAYDYPIDKPDAIGKLKMKVAYIKPFTTADGKRYFVGATYE
jgi:hypothetical protein